MENKIRNGNNPGLEMPKLGPDRSMPGNVGLGASPSGMSCRAGPCRALLVVSRSSGPESTSTETVGISPG
jgi:hypothetical protein